MRFKDIMLLFLLVLLVPVLSATSVYIVMPMFFPHTASAPYVSTADTEQINEDNFEPGKKAAYRHAQRYLSYAKDGSGFSAKSIRKELESLGYSESEIAYAINKIPEDTFVRQIVKMWKSYKEQGQTLSKIDAINRWKPLGFSKKEIDKAFKILEEE